MSSLKVLSLQPFYGGSHASFIDGWIRHSRHQWKQLTLPDRFWKWRMRHAALELASQLDEQWHAGVRFDRLVTTDMLNVAEFKGMLKSNARDVPLLVYFHENQLVYPTRVDDPRDLHFAFSNLTSALAADAVWFNSRFNRDSMVDELEKVASGWPDFRPLKEIRRIRELGAIHPPGIEIPDETFEPQKDSNEPIHLLWAARWEHDKGPANLLEFLRKLNKARFVFWLSVIGQSYSRVPEEFEIIKNEFANNLVRFGYQASREDYWQALGEADVILSTAEHEFFGLSVLEGIAAGLVPVIPNRLAYPEVIESLQLNGPICLYDSLDEAAEFVIAQSCKFSALRDRNGRLAKTARVTEVFGWPNRAGEMDLALEQIGAA